MMHMSAVIGAAAMMMDWTHEKTKDSDDIQCVLDSPRAALTLQAHRNHLSQGRLPDEVHQAGSPRLGLILRPVQGCVLAQRATIDVLRKLILQPPHWPRTC